ncbi:hypothetical protein BC938DRAFT_477341, partial [Jimgerdemannia flammicorona]
MENSLTIASKPISEHLLRDSFASDLLLWTPEIHLDLLEQLHHNISANQVYNYELLKKQHELLKNHQLDIIKWRDEEMARFYKIVGAQKNIEGSMAAIESIISNTQRKAEAINTILALNHDLLDLILSKHKEAVKLSARTTEVAQRGLQHVADIGSEMLQLKETMKSSQASIKIWAADMEAQHHSLSEQWTQTFRWANATLTELVTRVNREMQSVVDQAAAVHEDYDVVAGVFRGAANAVRTFYGEIALEFGEALVVRCKLVRFVRFVRFILDRNMADEALDCGRNRFSAKDVAKTLDPERAATTVPYLAVGANYSCKCSVVSPAKHARHLPSTSPLQTIALLVVLRYIWRSFARSFASTREAGLVPVTVSASIPR